MKSGVVSIRDNNLSPRSYLGDEGKLLKLLKKRKKLRMELASIERAIREETLRLGMPDVTG